MANKKDLRDESQDIERDLGEDATAGYGPEYMADIGRDSGESMDYDSSYGSESGIGRRNKSGQEDNSR